MSSQGNDQVAGDGAASVRDPLVKRVTSLETGFDGMEKKVNTLTAFMESMQEDGFGKDDRKRPKRKDPPPSIWQQANAAFDAPTGRGRGRSVVSSIGSTGGALSAGRGGKVFKTSATYGGLGGAGGGSSVVQAENYYQVTGAASSTELSQSQSQSVSARSPAAVGGVRMLCPRPKLYSPPTPVTHKPRTVRNVYQMPRQSIRTSLANRLPGQAAAAVPGAPQKRQQGAGGGRQQRTPTQSRYHMPGLQMAPVVPYSRQPTQTYPLYDAPVVFEGRYGLRTYRMSGGGCVVTYNVKTQDDGSKELLPINNTVMKKEVFQRLNYLDKHGGSQLADHANDDHDWLMLRKTKAVRDVVMKYLTDMLQSATNDRPMFLLKPMPQLQYTNDVFGAMHDAPEPARTVLLMVTNWIGIGDMDMDGQREVVTAAFETVHRFLGPMRKGHPELTLAEPPQQVDVSATAPYAEFVPAGRNDEFGDDGNEDEIDA